MLLVAGVAGQAPESPEAARVNDRIAALQKEADRLAGEAQSLITSVAKLEVERDLRAEELKRAQSARVQAERALQQTVDRLSDLEIVRVRQLPDLSVALVDIYKRRRRDYLHLLFSARDLREFARAGRAVAALTERSERRIREHQQTLDTLRTQQATFDQSAKTLQSREKEARSARAAADRAVEAATALIARIDAQRDLNAQYVGELQLAYRRLEQRMSAATTARGSDSVAVPLGPFRGALDWPVSGGIVATFGGTSSRPGGGVTNNGIEIASAEDTPVHAVHGGTVGFAGPFTGFGTLVIVDHGGSNYSLYGYLRSTSLQQGDTVASGAEVGRVGSAPVGPATLYFELRVDGRSVNPVQWLEPR